MPILKHPAVTSVPIHPLLAERWSSRAFSDEPVSRDILLSLFEAARWSPSCFNEQSWRFIVATRDTPDAHAQLAACFTPSNQRWCRAAWVLMVALAIDTFAADGSLNRMAHYDVGQAVQNTTVQASAHGLNVRQAAGIDLAQIRALYKVPDTATILCAVAIGYPGDSDALVPPLNERERQPRTRRPLSDLFFADEFGLPFTG